LEKSALHIKKRLTREERYDMLTVLVQLIQFAAEHAAEGKVKR